MTDERCTFEFAAGVRCTLIAGHDEPYYPYLDRGQTGYYSDILSKGTEHSVTAPAKPVPERAAWTGDEPNDTVDRRHVAQWSPDDVRAAQAEALTDWQVRVLASDSRLDVADIRVVVEPSEIGLVTYDAHGRFIAVDPEQISGRYRPSLAQIHSRHHASLAGQTQKDSR